MKKHSTLERDTLVDDAIISRETSYIYQYILGYEPVNNNLLHWRGIVNDASGQAIETHIIIPKDFPNNPPQVRVFLPDGSTELFTTAKIGRWRPDYHIFQIIKEVQQKVAKTSMGTASHANNTQLLQQQKKTLTSQVQNLRTVLQQKQREKQQAHQQRPSTTSSSENIETVKQESLFAIDLQLDELEDDLDRGMINANEFATNFVELRERYYLLELSK